MATATVNCDALNVRKGPGTGYGKIGTLSRGKTVTVTSTKNGWYAFKYNASTTGYISGSYCKYSSGGSTGGGTSGGSSANYTVTATTLNVRKGAGTNYGILGTLKNGQSVTSLGESNGWVKITFSGQQGYVSKKYLKAGGNGGGGSVNPPAGKKGTVTCTKLNVRKGPGTGYGILGSLGNGASFTYTEESNGWLKISYGSSTGWISKGYTSVGGGNSSGGGGGGGNNSLGQTAASQAKTLMSKYNAEKWTYNQSYRTSNGHYDCSSFCDRCWQAAGVNFGMTNSEGQAKRLNNAGAEVSRNNIQAGDLLFYHHNWNSGTRWKGINHVAIATSSSGRVDAGSTPVRTDGIGSPVFIGRPSKLKK